MSTKSDQKLREFERELARLIDQHAERLDEDSISEVLEEYRAQARAKLAAEEAAAAGAGEHDGQALTFDSEAVVGSAPRSEAQDQPTVEIHIGEAPDDHMPEAAVVMPRRPAPPSKHRPKPPPLPPQARRPAPGAPAQQPSTNAPVSPDGDLRPDREPTRRWRLTQTPLSAILLDLVTRPGAGLLDVRSGKHRAQLLVDDARLVEVRLLPCSTKRSLTAILERSGRLDGKQALRLRKFARRNQISEAQALLQTPNVLSPSEVRTSVRARMRHLIGRLMDASLNTASFFELDAIPDALRIASIPLAGVLFERMRARHTGSYKKPIDEAEAHFRGMELVRKSNLAFSINQLGLRLHERQLVDRVLTRRRSFEKVLFNSPLPKNDTIAILVGLEAVGLLDVTPIGLGGLDSASWSQEYELAVERLDWMEARLERETHFDILGVHWTTYDAEVDRAYDAVRGHFDTLNQPLGLKDADRKRVAHIRERLARIYAILSDPHRRRGYRQTLVPGSQRRRTAKKLQILGGAALRRKAFHSALDYYQRLLDLDPGNTMASRLLPTLLARTSLR